MGSCPEYYHSVIKMGKNAKWHWDQYGKHMTFLFAKIVLSSEACPK
jgi:hypothetical protein